MGTVICSVGLVAVSKQKAGMQVALLFFETGRIESENGLVLTSDTLSTDTV
jgi:hypothetical protein